MLQDSGQNICPEVDLISDIDSSGEYTLNDPLRKLIQTPRFKNLFDSFTSATGFPIWIKNVLDDSILIASHDGDFCTGFREGCPWIKQDSVENPVDDNDSSSMIHIKNCKNGLFVGIVPVLFRGKHLADIYAGQFFSHLEKKNNFQKIRMDCDFRQGSRIRHIEDIPVVDKNKADGLLRFMQQMVELLVDLLLFKDEEKLLEASRNQETNLRRELENAQERFTEILEATSDMVSTATPDGKLTYLNKGGRLLCGMGLDIPISQTNISDFHPDWAYKLIEETGIPTALKEGLWSGESAIHTPSGREIPVSQVIIAHRDSAGNLQYFSTIIRDISIRKENEDALRQSEMKYRLLAENASDLIFTCGGNEEKFKFHFVNPSCENLFGYTQEEMLQLNMQDRFPDKYFSIIEKSAADIIRNGGTKVFELQFYHKDGHLVDCEVTAKLMPIGTRGTGYISGQVK